MYLGTGFSTIDEFAIFVNTTSVMADENRLPREEAVAAWRFNEFVTRHLHGHFKASCWRYDLLARHQGHEEAVCAAMILFLKFAAMLRERGVDRVQEIMELAPSAEHFSPLWPLGELERLVDEAIAIHSPPVDPITPEQCEQMLADLLATSRKPSEESLD